MKQDLAVMVAKFVLTIQFVGEPFLNLIQLSTVGEGMLILTKRELAGEYWMYTPGMTVIIVATMVIVFFLFCAKAPVKPFTLVDFT